MTCNQAKYHKMHQRHPRYRSMYSQNFQNWAKANASRNPFAYPPTNIQEEDDHYVIHLKVPGYAKADFKISLNDKVLAVSSKVERKEGEGMNYQEFEPRSFKRLFELNEKIDSETIKAEYTEGILRIRMDKKEEFHRKEVEITVD